MEFAAAGPNDEPPAEDKEDLTIIMKKFDAHIMGEVNETYERYKYNKRDQALGESIDDYVSSLKDLAKTCNFCDCLKDTLLRDRIVLGIKDNATRKVLLQKRRLSLKQSIDICRGSEATTHQLKSLGCDKDKETISRIIPQKKKPASSGRRQSEPKTQKNDGPGDSAQYGASARRNKPMINCKFCGQSHILDRRICPAWGKTCNICNGRNHAESKCFKKKVHGVFSDYDSDESIDLVENVYKVDFDVCNGNKNI